MDNIKHIVSLLTLIVSWMFSSGQGLVQCGGHVVFDNGGYLIVDGNGDYYDTLGGNIDIVNDGYMQLPGDWINASGGGVFTSNDGEVKLSGANQNIKGNSITLFPTLELAGTADKVLQVDALLGGGFNGGGPGQLRCNNLNLVLNSNTLTINNKAENGISYAGGGIISETPNSVGYGTVEWVVRESAGNYVVPFKTLTGTAVPFTFNIQTSGINTIDSGLVSVSTYPTQTNNSPNNRELPSGVTNTLNEFGVEHAHRLIDRFWIVGTPNYSNKPVGLTRYGYGDDEWNTTNGSTNDIRENNLRPMRFGVGTNTWLFNRNGNTNAVSNYSEGVRNDFEGIWTLADSTICPEARFTHLGNCEDQIITFTDMSTVSKGTVDSWNWNFGDGSNAILQNPSHVYPDPNTYNVQLKIVGSTGCPDSITTAVVIDAAAKADFSYDDDPLVDIPVQFTSLSENATLWDWDFGDFNKDNIENPKHTYSAESSYVVTLIANNRANCPDTTSQKLDVNLPSLFLFPSAFSPGTKDDINKDFGLTTLQRVSEFHMTIYNRWGEKIFETDDVNMRWDGTYQKKPVPAGSYLYTVWFRDRTMKGHGVNGTVLLVR